MGHKRQEEETRFKNPRETKIYLLIAQLHSSKYTPEKRKQRKKDGTELDRLKQRRSHLLSHFRHFVKRRPFCSAPFKEREDDPGDGRGSRSECRNSVTFGANGEKGSLYLPQ